MAQEVSLESIFAEEPKKKVPKALPSEEVSLESIFSDEPKGEVSLESIFSDETVAAPAPAGSQPEPIEPELEFPKEISVDVDRDRRLLLKGEQADVIDLARPVEEYHKAIMIEGIKKQPKQRDRLPYDVSMIEPKVAEKWIKAYEAAGVEPEIELTYGYGPDNERETFVRNKEKIIDPTYKKVSKYVAEREKKRFGKGAQDFTSATEQLAEGLIRDTERLMLGAAEILTGEEMPSQIFTYEKIPFEHLSTGQKTAFVVGNFMGLAGPGAVFNAAGKGLVKTGLSVIRRPDLFKAASTEAQILSKHLIARAPFETVRAGLEASSNSFIKNWGTLSLEGAMWEYADSRGDVERAIHGAWMFPLVGSALPGVFTSGVAGTIKSAEIAGKAARKIKGLFNRPSLRGKTPITRKVESAEAGATFADLKGGEQELMTVDPALLKDPHYVARKKVLLAKDQAAEQVDREIRQAKILNQHDAYESKIKKQEGLIEINERQKSNEIRSRAKTERHNVVEDAPTSIKELPLGEAAKKRVQKYGSLDGMYKWMAAENKTMYEALRAVGLNHKEAYRVVDSIKYPKLIVKPRTPAGEGRYKYKTSKIKAHDSVLKKARQKIANFKRRQAKLRDNPLWNPEASPEMARLSKMGLKEAAARAFLNQTQRMGLDTRDLKPSWLMSHFPENFMTQGTFWNMVEASTGIPVHQVRTNLILGNYKKSHLIAESSKIGYVKNLSKLQRLVPDGKKLYDLMHYTYMTKPGPGGKAVWNPNGRTGKGVIDTPALAEKEIPSAETIELMLKLRENINWGREIISRDQKVGFLENYVAARRDYNVPKEQFSAKKKLLKKKGLLHKRGIGLIPEELKGEYITDMYKLMPRMMTDSINTAAYSGIMEQANSAYHMLKATSDKRADRFMNYVQRSMGTQSKEDAIEAMSMHMFSQQKDWVEYFGKLAEQEIGGKLTTSMWQTLTKNMFNGYIGSSPTVLVKQFMQPFVVGGAEVGLHRVAKAKLMVYGPGALSKAEKMVLGRSKDYQKISSKFMTESDRHLDRVRQRLYADKTNFSDLGQHQQTRTLQVARILELPGELTGMKIFTSLDKANREVMFLAGRDYFKSHYKKGNSKEAMAHLLPAERNRMTAALEEYGTEAFYDEGGLIISERANFAYDIADKPEWFAEGIGKHVPFVTWQGNQWMRHLQNLDMILRDPKNPKAYVPLGTRLAVGFGGVLAFQ